MGDQPDLKLQTVTYIAFIKIASAQTCLSAKLNYKHKHIFTELELKLLKPVIEIKPS